MKDITQTRFLHIHPLLFAVEVTYMVCKLT